MKKKDTSEETKEPQENVEKINVEKSISNDSVKSEEINTDTNSETSISEDKKE